jgi:beta-lactamase class A
MMFKAKGISGIRFGPGERLLQSATAGLTWRQDYSLGRNFEQARAALPMGLREDLLENYIKDPMDGATPQGMVGALGHLAAGQLLSPQSTAVMMEILSKTHSGPMRLKAGAGPGWKVFHKTGTGQELGRVATGYNDVGLLQAPDGSYYAVAVLIKRTTQPIPVRMELMQGVSRAVAQFHEAASTK